MISTPSITGFRFRLMIGMMLVVCAVTALALWIAQNKVTSDMQRQAQHSFQGEIATLHREREVRHTALLERSRSLASKPRIHAALEDNALDLLYPNAKDELQDVMDGEGEHPLHARFYRFLGSDGKVIPAPPGVDAGILSTAEEARLSMPRLPETQQIGYLAHDDGMDEIITSPIISTDTDEVIACIVLGFKPFDLKGQSRDMKAGIWTNGQLYLPNAPADTIARLAATIRSQGVGSPSEITLNGSPYFLLAKLLNPDSLFPPAHEVCLYSFAEAVERRQQVRWQILGAGSLLLLGAGILSHLVSGRLSMPVKQLAVDSARNEMRREEAEAALQQTSVELHRSMRFSADTSHQLKTPITVLRAGLEELQKQPEVTQKMHGDIADLIFQTAKLSSMIHDLLLLSRLDAGRLELQMNRIDLPHFIDSLADDLSALPGAPDFEVKVEVPRDLHVLGDKRYISMILQNLLENAWKYNVPRGIISIRAQEVDGMAVLRIGNTGPGIPLEAQEHVFERFHRAAVAENVPGHGLGLNIARELALLHGGDLSLILSRDAWTEFEVRFRTPTKDFST